MTHTLSCRLLKHSHSCRACQATTKTLQCLATQAWTPSKHVHEPPPPEAAAVHGQQAGAEQRGGHELARVSAHVGEGAPLHDGVAQDDVGRAQQLHHDDRRGRLVQVHLARWWQQQRQGISTQLGAAASCNHTACSAC